MLIKVEAVLVVEKRFSGRIPRHLEIPAAIPVRQRMPNPARFPFYVFIYLLDSYLQVLSWIEEGTATGGLSARHRAIVERAIATEHPWVSAIYEECKETGDVRGLVVSFIYKAAAFFSANKMWSEIMYGFEYTPLVATIRLGCAKHPMRSLNRAHWLLIIAVIICGLVLQHILCSL